MLYTFWNLFWFYHENRNLVYGNDDNYVLFGRSDVDFINGGKGNDGMYVDFGKDMLEGVVGGDYFDLEKTMI